MFEAILGQLIPTMGPLGSVILLLNTAALWMLFRKLGKTDHKIDRMGARESTQELNIQGVAKELTSVNHKVDLLAQDLKSLGSLRERVAVLEDRFNRRR